MKRPPHQPLVELSVIIPAFDESATVCEVAAGVLAAAGRLTTRFEVIVIDDGSQQPVASFLPAHSKIRVHRKSRRGGLGAALKTGFHLANGEWVLWIDADGTYEPANMGTFWAHREGAEQIIGSRAREFGRLAFFRRSLKRLACWRASRRWQRPIPDLNCGMRLIKRSAAQAWSSHLPDGFSCSTTATLAAIAFGQQVEFVPIDYRPRPKDSRSKFRPVGDTLRFFRTVERWKNTPSK